MALLRRLAFLLCWIALMAVPGLCAEWDLVLLTTADTEGRLTPALPEAGGEGKVEPGQGGGFPRLASAVAALAARNPGKTLLLSAGEDCIGPFYQRFHGAPIYLAMNRMGYAAGTLGNHEFDMGDAFLAQALENCAFPILAANLAVDPASPLAGKISRWKLINAGDLRVGVLGLVNGDLSTISKPGPLLRVDRDYAAVAREGAARLRAEGADLVIALAQIGLKNAFELAEKVPDLDVISAGDADMAVDRGRELVRHPDGRITVVTQTGQGGAYLGALKLKIKDRRIADYFWNLIPVDASLPEDAAVANIVSDYEKMLPRDESLARLAAPLDVRKKSLRTGETAAGDFVCDLLRERFKTDFALYNGGGIRGDAVIPEGGLNAAQVRQMFPFGDNVVILTMKGKTLRQALERGVASLPEAKGHFLQVSGLRYEVDPAKQAMALTLGADGQPTAVAKEGSRVVDCRIADGPNAKALLDPETDYQVAVSAFLAGGGDGYVMFRDLPKRDMDVPVADVVIEAVRAAGALELSTDGRIVVRER